MKKRTNETLAANHAGFFGTTGSGKTYQLQNHPAWKTCKRVLIWDPEESYKVKYRIKDDEALKAFYHKNLGYSGEFVVGFSPNSINEESFELFCQIALRWGHAGNPLLVIVEELADVARIGKASPYWGQLARKGRKYGTVILYASQKPQEIDKTIIDQSAVFGTGMLKTRLPRKYMAELLDVSLEEISSLKEKDFIFRRGADDAVLVPFGKNLPKNFQFFRKS